MTNGKAGYTLMELIILLLIVAIIAIVAIPRWMSIDVRLASAADRMMQDIRYAQMLAISTGRTHEVRIGKQPGNFYLIRDSSGKTIVSVYFNKEAAYREIKIWSVESPPGTEVKLPIYFSSLGEPQRSGGGSFLDEIRITLVDMKRRPPGKTLLRTIYIAPLTGKVGYVRPR